MDLNQTIIVHHVPKDKPAPRRPSAQDIDIFYQTHSMPVWTGCARIWRATRTKFSPQVMRRQQRFAPDANDA